MLSNTLNRIELPFRRRRELYSSSYRIIGFYPYDISYYKLALMHKGVMHRSAKGKPMNNERLEFLSDAILDATVGYIVYEYFPDRHERFLTSTRSKLARRSTLNKLASEMGICEFILNNGRNASHNSCMGGNTLEALVGAIYLDRGYNVYVRFMRDRILKEMFNIDKVAYKEVNFKSKLIEWSQKNKVKIDFELLNRGQDRNDDPVSKYTTELEGIEGYSGEGFSKKESQQLASKLALGQLKHKSQFVDEMFAAETNRTKMEEEPVVIVPDTHPQDDFIVAESEDLLVQKHESPFQEEVLTDSQEEVPEGSPVISSLVGEIDELHLDDISAQKMSGEETIAKAEEEALSSE